MQVSQAQVNLNLLSQLWNKIHPKNGTDAQCLRVIKLVKN